MPKKSKTPSLSRNVSSATPTERQSAVRGRASAAQPADSDVAPAHGDPLRDVANDTSSSVEYPTHREIAEVAYRLFIERGGAHGYDAQDWYEAERELRLRSR